MLEKNGKGNNDSDELMFETTSHEEELMPEDLFENDILDEFLKARGIGAISGSIVKKYGNADKDFSAEAFILG